MTNHHSGGLTERRAAQLGVLGAVLTLIGGFGAFPVTMDSSAMDIATWVAGNGTLFAIGVPLLITGWLLLLIMGAAVSQRLSGAQGPGAVAWVLESRVVLALWVVMTTLAIVPAVLQSTVVALHERVEGSVLTAFYVAYAISDLGPMIPLGVLLLVVSVTGYRIGWLPRWVMVWGVMAGLSSFAAVSGFIVYSGAAMPQSVLQTVATLLAYVWVFAVAAFLTRPARVDSSSA